MYPSGISNRLAMCTVVSRMGRKSEYLPSLRVTPAVRSAVEKASAELDRPVSWIMTDAILAWLREYQSAPEHTKARSDASS